MDWKKFEQIRQLEDRHVIRELPPVADSSGNTLYWHFEVLNVVALPSELATEYAQLREIRC